MAENKYLDDLNKLFPDGMPSEDTSNPYLKQLDESFGETYTAPVNFEKPVSQMVDEIGYGFASGTSITESAANIMESKIPLGRLELNQEFPFVKYVPPSPEFMAIYNASKASPQDFTDSMLMEQLQKEKQERVEERYEGTALDRESGWSTVGEVASMMVDPTSLMPLGAAKVVNGVNVTSIGSAAAAGGALAGTEVGLADFSGHGDYVAGSVDWQSVGIATALGAVLTGGIAKLGNKFRTRVEQAAESGQPMTSDSLMNIDNVDEVIANGDEFISSINNRLGLTDAVPANGKYKWTGDSWDKVKQAEKKAKARKPREKSLEQLARESKERVRGEKPKETELPMFDTSTLKAGTSEATVSGLKSADIKLITKSYAEGQEIREILNSIATVKDLTGQFVPVKGAKIQDVDDVLYKKYLRENEAWRKAAMDRTSAKEADYQKMEDIASFTGPKRRLPEGMQTQMDVAWTRLADEHKMDVEALKSQLVHQKSRPNFEPTIHDVATMRPAIRHPLTNEIFEAVSEEEPVTSVLQRAAKEDPSWSSVTPEQIAREENVGFQGHTGAFYTPQEATALRRVMNNRQAGAASTNLMSMMAGTGIGYAWDGPEGAAIGFLGGAAAPWAFKKMHHLIRYKSNPFNWANHFLSGYTIASPRAVLDKMGVPGKKLAYNLGIARNNGELQVANKVADMQVMFAKHGIFDRGTNIAQETQDQIMRLMQREIDPKTVPPNVRAAANELRGLLNKAVNDSVNVGLITKERGAQLLQNAKTKGYWPRIYNDNFLSTDAGEKLWVETLAGRSMDERTAKDILETIMGEHHKALNEKLMSMLERGADGKPTGKFKFTRNQAKDLLKQRRRFVASGRSVHMEKGRKLHVESEEMLKPFLISDPHYAMASYFQDVYKQIEFARVFGGNDSKAIKLINEISETNGEGAGKMATQTYLTAVGDPRAFPIRQAMGMNEGVRAAFQKADAITTLNLSMAQILNSLQATVNGSIALANYSANPYRVGKTLLRSWWDADKSSVLPGFVQWRGLGMGTETGRVVGERSAAALETTILQYVGEMSNLAHTITGKNYTGPASTLNVINNPTTFLKYTGFIGVETLQRKLAANMGFHAAVDLLERKTKALASGNKKALSKIDKHLTELGISTVMDPADIIAEGIAGADSQLLRAGLRFSDMVNFRNVAENMPLAAQSPYARIFRKFKTFAFHQGKFVKDKVITPAMEGNFWPMAWWMAMAAGPGASVAHFRDLLRQGQWPEEEQGNFWTWIQGADKEEKNSIANRLSDGLANIGALGLFWDTLSSTAYGEDKPIAGIAGPAISHASGLWHGAAKSLQNKDAYDFAKAALNTQVFPGKQAIIDNWSR